MRTSGVTHTVFATTHLTICVHNCTHTHTYTHIHTHRGNSQGQVVVESDKRWRLKPYQITEWKDWLDSQREFASLPEDTRDVYVQVCGMCVFVQVRACLCVSVCVIERDSGVAHMSHVHVVCVLEGCVIACAPPLTAPKCIATPLPNI